jgi:hypothetical protein
MVMPGFFVVVDEGVLVVVEVRLVDDGLVDVAFVVGVPAACVRVAAVGEVEGVVRGFEREAVVAAARGDAVAVSVGVGKADEALVAGDSADVFCGALSAALLGSMNAKTPTAVRPPIQTRTRLGSGFQLPPLVTEWRWRPSSRT